jgi:hypothetical protein
MVNTDAKRGKINELLDYIETRLQELNEEKEELEFQEKDNEGVWSTHCINGNLKKSAKH